MIANCNCTLLTGNESLKSIWCLDTVYDYYALVGISSFSYGVYTSIAVTVVSGSSTVCWKLYDKSINVSKMASGISSSNMLPEIEQVINLLERGTIVTRFYLKKRPEKRMLRLRKETRQLVWCRTTNTNIKTYEGCCNYNFSKSILWLILFMDHFIWVTNKLNYLYFLFFSGSLWR